MFNFLKCRYIIRNGAQNMVDFHIKLRKKPQFVVHNKKIMNLTYTLRRSLK